MLYTALQVAERTGKHYTTIRYHARKNGIGRKMGRDWFFTEKDIEEIEQIKPGNQHTTTRSRLHVNSSKSTVGSHEGKRKYPVRILAVVPTRSHRDT